MRIYDFPSKYAFEQFRLFILPRGVRIIRIGLFRSNRYADQERTTRSCTLVRPVAASRDLAALATDLLRRTQAGIRPVRLVGLAVASLIRSRRDDRQLDLFSSQS